MRFFDVFCGAGGLSYGFLTAGFSPGGGLDISKAAVDVYRSVFKVAIRRDAFFADLVEYIKNADIVLACPPCQGFSNLRLASGAKDDRRNGLVDIFVDAVRRAKPPLVVFENVPGIRRYEGFKQLLAVLRGLGYSVVYDVIDAADYGVPQHRRRIVLIASRLRTASLPRPTHGDPSSAAVRRGELLPWRTVREAIGDLPPVDHGECHPSDPLHCAKRLPPNHLRLIEAIPKNGGTRFDAPPELWLDVHRRRPRSFRTTFARMRWDAPSPTITTKFFDPSSGPFVHPEQDRGLTLREGARLQTFPDEYPFRGGFRTVARLIGEAFPPLLARVLAEHIKRYVV
ncbi:MAG: DNA cytosine methyltransferase [Pyrobaculum sp.]